MKTLIIVHKTHLDVGFTNLAGAVVDQYLNQFIPAALERAREMNTDPDQPRFVWTTGAWIVWKALQEYRGDRRKELVDAIERGWIAWHALPFTFHTELLTPNLLRLALKFSGWLDTEFGRNTISAKMTDVPGHTIGLVPILAEAGIRFLHLGVNPASKVPEVPGIFRWRCGDDELLVNYADTYGSVTQCEGCETAFTFFHTNDNLGPPSAEAITREETWLRARFQPGMIRSGSIDDFAQELIGHVPFLPVLKEEIGDTWIHGAASDPQKLADYAALRRVVEPEAEHFLDLPLEDIGAWLEPLLLLPEHTWGLDVKAWFGDHRHYRPAELAEIRRSHRFRTLEQAWQEQRDYLDQAVERLKQGKKTAGLSGSIDRELEGSRAIRRAPSAPEDGEALDVTTGHVAGRWAIRFEPASGSLSQLYDTETGLDLCPDHGRLAWGIVQYELYGRKDYTNYLRDYFGEPPYPWWAVEDFSKIGLPPELERGLRADLRFGGGRIRALKDRTEVVTSVQFLGEGLVLEGAPEDLAVAWTFHHREPVVGIRLGWNRKAATRLPESCWFGFRLPGIVSKSRYKKLGQWIDPASVVPGGGRALHATEGSVRCDLGESGHVLAFESPDALLVAPDIPRILHVPTDPPAGTRAVWFNLSNNVWNTNFPLWQGGPMGWRFRVELGASASPGE